MFDRKTTSCFSTFQQAPLTPHHEISGFGSLYKAELGRSGEPDLGVSSHVRTMGTMSTQSESPLDLTTQCPPVEPQPVRHRPSKPKRRKQKAKQSEQ